MKRLIAELSLMREHVTPAQRRVLERAIKEIVELADALHAYRVPAMRPRITEDMNRSYIHERPMPTTNPPTHR
jgi:hypothetical protein